MSDIFAESALARLSQVLGLRVQMANDTPGPGLLLSPLSGSAMSLFSVRGWRSFDTIENEMGATWLGLLELAIRFGYVTPSPAHLAAASDLARRVLNGYQWFSPGPDVALIEGLVSRVSADAVGSPETAFDEQLFNAFESYLSLTRTVAADNELLDAVQFTHTRWAKGADNAALLSPASFASALATGHVGAVAVPGVQGMLSTLGAFDWLMAIVKQVEYREDLRDGLLAHASWSHGALECRERLDRWAVALSEFTRTRDRAGEERWVQFRTSVLHPLEQHQARLGLDRFVNANFVQRAETDVAPLHWSIGVEPEELERWVHDRVAEGRVESARRTLLIAAEKYSRLEEQPLTAENAERLIDLAARIAALGDTSTAAALVAPHIGRIEYLAWGVVQEAQESSAEFSIGQLSIETLERARGLCAAQRRLADTDTLDETTESRERRAQKLAEAEKAAKQVKHRSVSEN